MYRLQFIKYRYVIGGLVILFILIVGAKIVLSHLNQSDSVKLSASTKSTDGLGSYSVNITPTTQSNSYASFDYPKGMTLKSTTLLTPNSLADYRYYAKDVYSWTLAVDISNVPAGELSQDSSYQLRVNNPSEYIRQNIEVNGQPVTVFSDSQFGDGFSKVAYLTDGGRVATVSLTGDDSSGTAPLEKSFNNTVSSWRWL